MNGPRGLVGRLPSEHSAALRGLLRAHGSTSELLLSVRYSGGGMDLGGVVVWSVIAVEAEKLPVCAGLRRCRRESARSERA